MIVADTQMLVYLTTPGPETELSRSVLVRDAEWAAPRLWRSEFRNALLGYLRNGRISVDGALASFQTAAIVVGGREYEADTALLLRLAAQNRITAYDLEFVLVAELLGVPLVTFDKQVLAAFPAVAVHPSGFVLP